jgi:transposase
MTPAMCATAGLCLKVLGTKRTGAPAISRLRTQLRDHTTRARRGKVHADLAESLLHGLSIEATSPVDLAYAEANTRARWFRAATDGIVLSLVAPACLVVQIFQQV